MPYDPNVHHRRSIRLKDYDYTRPGAYFVTIATYERVECLGEVVDGEMSLSEEGRIAAETLQWVAGRYSYAELDAWVVMPNHVHAIIVFTDDDVGTNTYRRKPLGRIIGVFKTVSTKRVNQLQDTPGRLLWQRNYYEHVIRNGRSLERLRRYIVSNPDRWPGDPEHPGRL